MVLAKSILKLWIDVYLTLNVAFTFWKIERIILIYNNQSNLWIGNLEFSFHFLLWLFDQEISTIEYPEQQPKSFYNTLTSRLYREGCKNRCFLVYKVKMYDFLLLQIHWKAYFRAGNTAYTHQHVIHREDSTVWLSDPGHLKVLLKWQLKRILWHDCDR